jgi:hypothetical protein
MKVYTYENDFAQFVRDNDGTQVLRIDEEMYYYWLEALPPVYMDKIREVEIDGAIFKKRCSFGFAEGTETVTDFWRNGSDAFFCKRSKTINRGY